MKRDVAKRMNNQIPTLTMLQIIEVIAREAFAAGDFEGALTAAREALPYTTPRLVAASPIDPNAPTVDEIMADTDPEFMDDNEKVFSA